MEQNGADNSLHTVIFTRLWEYLGIIFCCVLLAAEVRLNAAATKVGLLPAQRAAGLTVKVQHLLCLQQNTAEWLTVVFHIQIH